MDFVVRVIKINILTPPHGCSIVPNGERGKMTVSMLLAWVVGGWHCLVVRGSSTKFIPCFHSCNNLEPPAPKIPFAVDRVYGL